MKRVLTLIALLGLVVLARPTQIGAESPYQIDVILPLTGSGAFLAKTQAEALGALETTVNTRGGVQGRPIHFRIQDDQTNPQVALQLVNTLLPQHPSIILGFTLAADCGAVIPVVAVAGPLVYCFSPAVEPSPGSYAFASSVSPNFIIPVMIKFARDRGARTIGLIDATDATGQAAERSFQATLALPENDALRVVSVQHFNPGEVSIAAEVANLKAARPDIVYTFASGPPFGNVLRTIHDAGLDVPVVASAANLNYEQLAQYSTFLPRQLFFNGFRYQEAAMIHGPLRNEADRFEKALRAAGTRPTPGHALGWDPALITIRALQKLGLDASPKQLRDYLENSHGVVGLNGVYDFRDGNHHGLNGTAVIVVRWDSQLSDAVPISGPGGSKLQTTSPRTAFR